MTPDGSGGADISETVTVSNTVLAGSVAYGGDSTAGNTETFNYGFAAADLPDNTNFAEWACMLYETATVGDGGSDIQVNAVGGAPFCNNPNSLSICNNYVAPTVVDSGSSSTGDESRALSLSMFGTLAGLAGTLTVNLF